MKHGATSVIQTLFCFYCSRLLCAAQTQWKNRRKN